MKHDAQHPFPDRKSPGSLLRRFRLPRGCGRSGAFWAGAGFQAFTSLWAEGFWPEMANFQQVSRGTVHWAVWLVLAIGSVVYYFWDACRSKPESGETRRNDP